MIEETSPAKWDCVPKRGVYASPKPQASRRYNYEGILGGAVVPTRLRVFLFCGHVAGSGLSVFPIPSQLRKVWNHLLITTSVGRLYSNQLHSGAFSKLDVKHGRQLNFTC